MVQSDRARIIVITNQKGGVGKSTTAEALAEGLTIKGYRSLLVDLDPQGSITLTAGINPDEPTSYELLTRSIDTQEAVQQRTQQVTQQHTQEDAQQHTQEVNRRADIIAAGKQLARLDMELTTARKEYQLKEQLTPLLPVYNFIVIDTPPALGILTVNALTAADSLIIPAQADVYSLQGIRQLKDAIDAIQAYTNPGLSLDGILLTRHTPRSIISRDMTEAANATAKRIGTFLYRTVIRENVAVKEAQANQRTIYDYAPKSNAAVDYMAFVDEYLERSGKEFSDNG